MLAPTKYAARPAWAADEAIWTAIIEKDRRSDGKFVYVAVTTGIYCRPSCPARNPHRRNTLIFANAAQAEAQGYAACRRCHPNSLTPAEESIKAALDYIEVHVGERFTLATLSRVSGFSPHHLRETFQKIVGLSPKDFSDVRRIARFKEHLRAGHSVSSACYEAGFGSSRALYEKARHRLGMTPASYKRGGRSQQISFVLAASALGRILIARTPQGVCAVLIGENDSQLAAALRREFPHGAFAPQSPRADKNGAKSGSKGKWESEIRACETEDPLISNLPLNLRRRILQARLWNRLT